MSEAKSEQKSVATESKSESRPPMNKRVERKDDGRTLIYYTFDEKKSGQNQSGESEGGK